MPHRDAKDRSLLPVAVCYGGGLPFEYLSEISAHMEGRARHLAVIVACCFGAAALQDTDGDKPASKSGRR